MTWKQLSWSERKLRVYQLVRRLQPEASVIRIKQAIFEEYNKDVAVSFIRLALEQWETDGFLRSEKHRLTDRERIRVCGSNEIRYWFATGKPIQLTVVTSNDESLAIATA